MQALKALERKLIHVSLIIDSALQAYGTVLKQRVPKCGLQPATSSPLRDF